MREHARYHARPPSAARQNTQPSGEATCPTAGQPRAVPVSKKTCGFRPRCRNHTAAPNTPPAGKREPPSSCITPRRSTRAHTPARSQLRAQLTRDTAQTRVSEPALRRRRVAQSKCAATPGRAIAAQRQLGTWHRKRRPSTGHTTHNSQLLTAGSALLLERGVGCEIQLARRHRWRSLFAPEHIFEIV